MVRFSRLKLARRAMVALPCALAWLIAAFSGSAAASTESAWNRNDHAGIRLVAAASATAAAENAGNRAVETVRLLLTL